MKHKALYRLWMAFILMTLGSGIMRSQEPSLLVEEGRTWWYEYQYKNPESDWLVGNFGLTLQGDEEKDGHVWQKCFIVDERWDMILDQPIAMLRQDGDQVYVTPKLLTPSEEEILKSLPARFWDVYCNFLYCDRVDLVDDEVEVLTGEYLLYDWNMQNGDTIDYPWILVYPLPVEKITIISTTLEDNRKTWRGTWGWNDKIYIVEGIGSIASNPNTNIGTFLYPCCYKSVTVDMNGEPDYVNLTRVTTKDGTVLWDNHSGVETIEADAPSPADDAVYDLHGRRVANPQRGGIYIRGGHKFVGR